MSNILNKLKVKDASQTHSWYNKDLLPTSKEHRTWGVYHFLFFYFTTSLTPSSYVIGSTLTTLGLLWWHAIICAVIGSFILSIVLVLNSRAPSVYHMGYPTIVRSVAGMRGSYFFIFIRISVAAIYFAVQTYFCANLTSVCLRCIFGHKWHNLENKLPPSAGITSQLLLSFFIIWILQFPLMLIHPKHQRHIFTIKMFTTTTSLFAVFGYCVRKAGGTLGTPESLASGRVYGSELAWGMIYGINSIMNALCPILINTGDVVRYAKKPSDAAWIQSFAVLFSKVLITFLGCGTTSAAKVFLKEAFWNPWDLYNALLDYNWSPSMRTGIFFASLGMIIALLAVNIGTNCLPVGADLTGMAPKYVTIVRGQLLCWVICPLLFPWKIISSGQAFLAFLGSYSVMLCPICAVMVYDYFIIKKGNYHTPSFYNPDKSGPYWYNRFGINWRAIIAWALALALCIPGVSNSVNPGSIGIGAVRIYNLGFIVSFLSGMLFYGIICYLFPIPQPLPRGMNIKELKFEQFSENDGYLENETLDDILEDKNQDEITDDASTGLDIEKNPHIVAEKELHD